MEEKQETRVGEGNANRKIRLTSSPAAITEQIKTRHWHWNGDGNGNGDPGISEELSLAIMQQL